LGGPELPSGRRIEREVRINFAEETRKQTLRCLGACHATLEQAKQQTGGAAPVGMLSSLLRRPAGCVGVDWQPRVSFVRDDVLGVQDVTVAHDNGGDDPLTHAQLHLRRLPIGAWALGEPAIEARSTNAHLRAKRVLDVVCALVLLAVLAPVLLVVAVLVRIDSPGPIIFHQQRIGVGGRPFVMYKFRTMQVQSDVRLHQVYYADLIKGSAQPRNGLFKLTDDPRVTRVGHILRRFSLDELPQLVNIVRGDMSLVGPRPPLPYEVDLYGPRDRLRLEVLPGLTGLWQVSGRSRLGFQEMIELDLAYIEQWSIWLDLWIMLRTPLVVLGGSDAS